MRNKIIGWVVLCIDILALTDQLYLLYEYNFTAKLFLFMYPNWLLLLVSALLCVGIVLSILFLKSKMKRKPFLGLTIAIWVISILLLFMYSV